MYASIIVPTYNRREILERTLDAILDQTVSTDTYEIIVVDDCSSDDTSDYMEHMARLASNLIYIRHVKNKGAAITRNDGIKAARGDIVVFLDNDNVPDRHFTEAHIQYHEQSGNEHIAVMGNACFAPELVEGSNFARYLQSRYLGCRSPKHRKGLDYSDLPPRCLGTLNCSMRREDLMAVGMFDTRFRYYAGEDEYLGFCLKQLGVRIIFGEDARSLHYDDVSVLRYKRKITEVTREGYRIILGASPEYFEGTQFRFLLPIHWKRDSPKRIAVKTGIRILLNPITVFLCEHWAILTDGCPWLDFWPLYRLLMAGWSLQGYRSKQQGVRLVTYGTDRTDQ